MPPRTPGVLSPPDEAELVAAAQAGDKDATHRWFDLPEELADEDGKSAGER